MPTEKYSVKLKNLVGMKRLELPRLSALEPKSSVSTNSTTSPKPSYYKRLILESLSFILILQTYSLKNLLSLEY